jgi:D-serine deaminase-like pyridoxal phosphate-dependent protein
MDLKNIVKPALLLDETIARKNIGMMAGKARSSKVEFRPHFKTHQSAIIGEWFREEGVKSITVSSVTMAEYFATFNWNDITIALPLNVRELYGVEKLIEKIRLNILISSFEQAQIISHKIRSEVNCFIEIDAGNNRSGVEFNDHNQVMRIIDILNNSRTLRLKGFLTHSGHIYKARSESEIIDLYEDTKTKLLSLKNKVSLPGLLLSIGDTPSCSILQSFEGIDEIRPGNFVFYDLKQNQIGSCNIEQIAVVLACPVVEKKQRNREIVIYGGAVHLSKDSLKIADGRNVFGKAVSINKNGWISVSDNDYVRSLSQEHGVISASDELFKNIHVGDILGIIPVHSCLTADLLRQYHTMDGKIISEFSPK